METKEERELRRTREDELEWDYYNETVSLTNLMEERLESNSVFSIV